MFICEIVIFLLFVLAIMSFGSIADNTNFDAFSRLRVSDPTNLLSLQMLYDLEPTRLELLSTGTGIAPAFDTTDTTAHLDVAAGTGVSSLQSYQYVRYQPGKSQLFFAAFVMDVAVVGALACIGYFDDDNGIFFVRDEVGTLKFTVRNSSSGMVVDTNVEQAAWNLNTLSTLDVTLAQCVVFDLQCLGAGRVRVGFDIGGIIVYVHEFLFANIAPLPFMQTASLPFRVRLVTTATATLSRLQFKCASIISEGGQDTLNDRTFSGPDTAVTAGNGARTLLLTLRPKAVGINGLATRNHITITQLNLLVTGNNAVLWELTVGGSNVPGAFSDVAAGFSNFEVAPAGTHTNLTGGYVVASGYAAAGGQVKESLDRELTATHPCSLDSAGANLSFTTYTLLVTGIGGTSATRANLEFKEA